MPQIRSLSRRLLVTAGLAGGVLGAALATVVLPSGNEAEAQAPPTRLQLVIDRVHVLDDNDALTWGELTYRFRFQRGSDGCPDFWCASPAEDLRLEESMSATTSQVRGIYKVVGGGNAALTVDPGDWVRVGMAGVEEDWDGPGFAFCPPVPYSQFDDSLCGAHDALGVVHAIFHAGTNWGIGAHSQLVAKHGNRNFQVDYQIRQVPATATTTSSVSSSPTHRPTPTPRPTPRPHSGSPRRYEP